MIGKIDIGGFDLISFDIFDTLLLRAVKRPVDVFLYVWDRALEEELTLSELNREEFMKLRMECERRARRTSATKEVTLYDIYDKMPEYIVKDKNRLMDLELEMEKELCYLNPEAVKLLEKVAEQQKTAILVSDMYLTSREIMDILIANGFQKNWVEHVIVSCEEGKSKQSSELFEMISEKYPQIPKEKIIHIGDNLTGDYYQAKAFGIQAFHYPVILELLKSSYDYEKMRHGTPQPHLLSLRKIAGSLADESLSSKSLSNEPLREKEKKAFEIGASIVGPFLTLYISHVANRMKQLGIKRMYPLMREGWLLGELLKREVEEQELDILVKPIYTSRKASFIPAIEKINRESIENFMGVRNITVEELIVSLGLREDVLEEFEEFKDTKIKVSHTISLGNTNLKEQILNVLLQKENVRKIEYFVKKNRQLYVNYLQQEIADFENAATMDIGCFGRIQEWTEKALDLENVPHKMKHFFAIGTTGERVFDGLDIEGYFSTFAGNMDLITTMQRTPDILEKLISITEGSTIGYEEKDGKIIPIQGEGMKEHTTYNQAVFEGIFTFQKLWFYFRRQKPVLAKNVLRNKRETLAIYHRLVDMPTKAEVEVLMELYADTNFGTSYKAPIVTEKDLKLVKEKGVDFVDRCNISYTYENANIVWPKGVITLEDEFYYVRRVLKNGAGNENRKAMQDVVEQAISDGVEEIALYGAGETGREFYFVCELYGLKATCFIDRKESLWGTRKEGLPIMGLEQAMKQGKKAYLVTSLFSISEIKAAILQASKKEQKKVRIYTV